jgi:hypothetical protein
MSDDNDESDFIQTMQLLVLTSSVHMHSVILRLVLLSYTMSFNFHEVLCSFVTDHTAQMFSTLLSGEGSPKKHELNSKNAIIQRNII